MTIASAESMRSSSDGTMKTPADAELARSNMHRRIGDRDMIIGSSGLQPACPGTLMSAMFRPRYTLRVSARRSTALITGVTGQDGSYLAELLLSKGYEVHGIIRRSSSFNTGRIDHLYQDPHEADRRLILHYGDLNDASSLNHILRIVEPDEIYNLAAQTHVKVSFDTPEYTSEIDALGPMRLLEAIRELD